MASKPRILDLFLSKWIAAEAIFYLKENSYWHRADWTSNTKLHKIIYNTADQFDLPITRSWYIHGEYVHNYVDLDREYSKFVTNYIRSVRGPTRFRSKVKEIYPNADEILVYIHRISKEINDYKTDEYLTYLYTEEAPEKYKPSYLSKNDFTNNESNIKTFIGLSGSYLDDVSYSLELLDRIYDDITEYNINVYNVFSDVTLENRSRNLFSLFEDSLRKIDVLLNRNQEISYNAFILLNTFTKHFTYDVWKPYACDITDDTVIGPHTKNVIEINTKNWRKTSAINYVKHMRELNHRVNNLNLKTSYNDVLQYYNSRDSSIINDVFSLLKTYKKRKD